MNNSSSNCNKASVSCEQNNEITEIEHSFINANAPIDIDETEKITVNGITGIWVNKKETSHLDLSKYQINDDPDPVVVKKNPNLLIKSKKFL